MALTFKEKIKTISVLFKEPQLLSALISLRHSGYLLETGWLNSYKKKEPLDELNNPLPWMTHSFIRFIENRLKNDLSIFEFGSGNSTLYFAPRVKHVTSVEHNHEWLNKLKSKVPSNVELIYNEFPSEEYSSSVMRTKKKYDIIIDDAMDRVNVIYNSIASLTSHGVLILDDSEREDYREGIELLLKNNFKKLDFWGLAPGVLFNKCTTVFYKNNNCLDI